MLKPLTVKDVLYDIVLRQAVERYCIHKALCITAAHHTAASTQTETGQDKYCCSRCLEEEKKWVIKFFIAVYGVFPLFTKLFSVVDSSSYKTWRIKKCYIIKPRQELWVCFLWNMCFEPLIVKTSTYFSLIKQINKWTKFHCCRITQNGMCFSCEIL